MEKESGLSPALSGRNGDVPAGVHLNLCDNDAQVGKAMVKALNRMTLLGMLKSIRIA